MVTRDRTHRLGDLAAPIPWADAERAGAAIYRLGGDDAELLSLNAAPAGRGVGSALLAAIEETALQAGRRRLRLATTNDNVDALRCCQRRGYRPAALFPGAVDVARAVKPGIPAIGFHGTPIHDELVLEKRL